MIRRITLAIVALVGLAPSSMAQMPAGREDHGTPAPEWRGVEANAPTPAEYHVRNQGSDVDDLGLCVDATTIYIGAYHDVEDLRKGYDSDLWRYAKAHPGGSYPAKLQEFIREVYPDAQLIQDVGASVDLCDRLSAEGRSFGVTMNTGSIYGGQGIHHAVACGHFDSRADVAMIQDSNEPKVFRWMTATELYRRMLDGGERWVFWFDVPLASPESPPWILVVVAAILLFGLKRRRTSPLPS